MPRSRLNRYLGSAPELKIAVAFLSFFFIGYFIQEWTKSQKLYRCPRYTIAYTTGIETSYVLYRYTLDNKDYKGFWQIEGRGKEERKRGGWSIKKYVGRNLVGQRFLIRTSCKYPEVSQPYWAYSVPDSIQYAPPQGWEHIPENFPKTEFDVD